MLTQHVPTYVPLSSLDFWSLKSKKNRHWNETNIYTRKDKIVVDLLVEKHDLLKHVKEQNYENESMNKKSCC